MKALVIGGSRGIGLLVAQRLLKKDATVTFLLRNKACFDKDEHIQPYIASGKARIVPGNALEEEDVRRAWKVAGEGDDSAVDIVIFSIGSTTLNISLTKGLIITPPDLCARSMLNLLATFPRDSPTQRQPRLVCVSSNGLGRSAHSTLPCTLKPMYKYLLDMPHADKLGMERALSHAGGWSWSAADGEPDAQILPPGWTTRAGDEGWLTRVVIVRPALLTNGTCTGDAPTGAKYRAQETDMSCAYSISRRDIAHFIVERALADWSQWEGKCVRIAY
ncbi:hypothetical protein M0805_002176 [Coniferiporia weirii]|nr:hypothetical protein M0805_002176 [Coniferiporia weirii]